METAQELRTKETTSKGPGRGSSQANMRTKPIKGGALMENIMHVQEVDRKHLSRPLEIST